MSALMSGVDKDIQVKNSQEKYDIKLGIHEWKHYPEYKDSGVEWIGEIPNEWKVRKIKHTTYVKGRIGWQGLKSDEFLDEGPFLVTGTDFINGSVNWKSCYHVNEERYNEDPYIQLKENDLLITKDGTIGKVALVTGLKTKATLNSGVFVTRPLSGEYLTNFMYWLLNSEVFETFFKYISNGSTIQHLYQNVFVNFSFALPSLLEQELISNFLDHEISKVDTLIEKKQRFIGLLEEKRSALISYAVTKGLDPDVKMKDSGIEWIGEIPESWIISKLKHLTSKIGSGKTPRGGSEIYSDSGIVFLRSQNVHFDGLRLDDVVYIDKSIDSEMSSTRVLSDDVLLNITGASIGRSSIVPKDFPQANVNQHVCIIRPLQKQIDSRFLHYELSSDSIQALIFSNENGTSREGLTFLQISNFIIATPNNLNEQRLIADFLDRETEKIDTLINKISAQIEKLKEYRTTLISAAVTGKIDVREEVA
ncbi:restriction endonuclease subunit S [Methanosarcina mazei]|jgi:type I restriction enzyme S subunit|uniref:Type I restriction-modification system, specificity subunit S n=1 Tax=Methanosarcina mazei LYC TaxID=1434114 RepID=A0A0E3RN03_METMZ|nr:restriction endonuclease subunit S [Methanosarcina mazei]AKB67592.1 Type I restriction-modification system, specificity subunit S [Methanosarcina mazei LYC]